MKLGRHINFDVLSLLMSFINCVIKKVLNTHKDEK